jgi:hypothetical protein
MIKRCAKCGLPKDTSEFYTYPRNGKPRARCISCTKGENNARAAEEPAKHLARCQEWRKANPGRATAISVAYQKRHPKRVRACAYRGRYGIDFDAMWDSQSGLCLLCGEPMQPKGRQADSVCVDHDKRCCPGHKSCGKCVRGLIHWRCNLLLGYARDSADVLRKAASYIDAFFYAGASGESFYAGASGESQSVT